MAKACPKCKPTECEECPEWIFTFADLVMLMMGFFVILWVLKPAPSPVSKNGDHDQVLPIELLAAIREAFGHLPDPTSKDPVDVWMLMRKLEHLKPLKSPGDGGKTKLDRKVPQGTDPEVELVRPSKQVGTGAKVLFAPGDATLTPDSKTALDRIALEITGHTNIFMVKGHAASDDLPEGAPDDAKMELSLRRARAAAEYLVSKGVARDTLRVTGCSTYEPLVQRAYTGNTRSLNRRVEVESTPTLVKDLQDNLKEKEKRAAKAAEPAAAPKDALGQTGPD
ncbi:MAG TPA: OmpA family protein [Tepidisphaeraceae bacterium]|nr:OmpA family protein [Tepidisphaeraceae bacterium]